MYVKEKIGRSTDVLNEDGRGHKWMEMIERLRRERERVRRKGNLCNLRN